MSLSDHVVILQFESVHGSEPRTYTPTAYHIAGDMKLFFEAAEALQDLGARIGNFDIPAWGPGPEYLGVNQFGMMYTAIHLTDMDAKVLPERIVRNEDVRDYLDIQPPKPEPLLKDVYFDIEGNQALSEAIQKRLFELGILWPRSGANVQHSYHCPSLVIREKDGELCVLHAFKDARDGITELTLNDLYTLDVQGRAA